MKFSDLPKGKPSQPPPAAKEPAQGPPPAAPPSRPLPPASAAPLKRQAPGLAPAKPMPGSSLAQQRQSAHQVYGRAVAAVRKMFQELHKGSPESAELRQALRDMLELLYAGNQALLAMTTHSTASNYLYAHSTNVSIHAMNLACAIGWDKEAAHTLGFASLLHDIGMARHLGLTDQPRPLTFEEHQEIRLHPVEGQRLLEHFHDIEASTRKALAEIIGQEHERHAGKGYPKALASSDDIHLAAQIIGLCDIYEAMSHPRAWREPLVPHEAVKALIKRHSQDFDRRLLQLFVERLSLYPPGSWVQLSTGEVACVVEAHAKSPTRPTVEIKLKPNGSRQETPSIVNLLENPLVHVLRAIDETRLNLKDKKILMALEAQRWWVE